MTAVRTRNANGIRATEVAATPCGQQLLRVNARDAPESNRSAQCSRAPRFGVNGAGESGLARVTF
jgi:hypothetical protein